MIVHELEIPDKQQNLSSCALANCVLVRAIPRAPQAPAAPGAILVSTSDQAALGFLRSAVAPGAATAKSGTQTQTMFLGLRSTTVGAGVGD